MAQSIHPLKRLAAAGCLCLVTMSPPAQAQPSGHDVLVVLPDAGGAGDGLVKMYWRVSRNGQIQANLIGVERRNRPIPKDYFIGIQSENGDSEHWWSFGPNFLKESELEGGRLTLTRLREIEDCFTPDWLEQKRSRYHNGSDIPTLLNGVILFGYMYSVCDRPQTRESQRLAKRYVNQLYALLEQKLEGTFVGRMCPLDADCG